MTTLIIVLIIIAIPLVTAAFLSNDYAIEREVTINKPRAMVFDFVKLLKSGERYNKWVMADPGMKKEFRGTDGTVGAVYAWDSADKQVGKGEQEIIGMEEGQYVNCEIRFARPFVNTSYSDMILETVNGDQTRVKWVFKGLRNYSARIMHLLFNLQKMLGRDMQVSLINLKQHLEK